MFLSHGRPYTLEQMRFSNAGGTVDYQGRVLARASNDSFCGTQGDLVAIAFDEGVDVFKTAAGGEAQLVDMSALQASAPAVAAPSLPAASGGKSRRGPREGC